MFSPTYSFLSFFFFFEAPFCLQFYWEILQSPNGAFTWYFLKPLMHGKILYAPDVPEIRHLIHKVSYINFAFGFVAKSFLTKMAGLTIYLYSSNTMDINSVLHCASNHCYCLYLHR